MVSDISCVELYFKDPFIASSLVQVTEDLIKSNFTSLNVSCELNRRFEVTTFVMVLAAALEFSEEFDLYVIDRVVF